jgi:hypothetical protein
MTEQLKLPEMLERLEKIFKEREDVVSKGITCLRDDAKDFKEWKWTITSTEFR